MRPYIFWLHLVSVKTQDTPCGNAEDFYNIKPDEVIIECTDTGCVLTCVYGYKVPTVKYLTCTEGQFQHSEGSQDLIECYEPEDFGNVFYNLIAADDTFAGKIIFETSTSVDTGKYSNILAVMSPAN